MGCLLYLPPFVSIPDASVGAPTEASELYIRIYSYICIILWFKFVHFFPVFDIIRHNCNKIVSGAKA